jgi:Aconitase A
MASSSQLRVGDNSYEIFRLDQLQSSHDVARLPYTLRILLENVLRTAGEEDCRGGRLWVATAEPSREISFNPAVC